MTPNMSKDKPDYYLGRRWYSEREVKRIENRIENRIPFAMIAVAIMTTTYIYIMLAPEITELLRHFHFAGKLIALNSYLLLLLILITYFGRETQT